MVPNQQVTAAAMKLMVVLHLNGDEGATVAQWVWLVTGIRLHALLVDPAVSPG